MKHYAVAVHFRIGSDRHLKLSADSIREASAEVKKIHPDHQGYRINEAFKEVK